MTSATDGPVPATDQELVLRAMDGDRSAFTTLYRRHAPVVGRRLRRIVYQQDEVEDLLQTTFLEAHRNLHRFRPELPLANWLQGIAFQVTGRYLKARRRRSWLSFFGPSRPVELPHPGRANVEEHLSDRERVRQLYQALDGISASKRIAFSLVVLEGMGLAEAGELVGAPAKTVWARVESARKELKAMLGDDAPPPRAEVDR